MTQITQITLYLGNIMHHKMACRKITYDAEVQDK